MFASRSLVAVRPAATALQRRTFIHWYVKWTINRPNDFIARKKAFKASNPDKHIWLRYPTDIYTNVFGAGLLAYGMVQVIVMHYRLATGKGKMD